MQKFITLFFSITFFALGLANVDAVVEQKKIIAKEKIKDANYAVGDYAYSQKEEYVKKTKNELTKLRLDLADMENKVNHTSGEVKAEAEKKLDKLRASVTSLHERLEIVKVTSEIKWDEVKKGFNESIDGVQNTIIESRKWLSAKIAP
jgi:peptidoglycan hydrolase CwlO-like protein